jgi:hypothetical protein
MIEKLSPVRKSRDEASINRSVFLKSLIDSNGETLLKYVTIEQGSKSRILSKDIFNHIVNKAGVSLNRPQLSLVKHYLEKLGAKKHKTAKADWYLFVTLKDSDA